jgi:hypothetical protein
MNFWNKAAYVNNVSWGSYPKPTNIATNTSFEQIYTFVKRGNTRKIPKEILEANLLTKDEWRHWAVRCIWDDIAPVIKINAKGENLYGHGAPFPEDIPYRLIRMHTVKGETVLDPFLGSGTTLKVARLLGRHGIGFEINSEYENRIRDRIMEDWSPPVPDEGYITVGYKTLKQIVLETLGTATEKGFSCPDEEAFVAATATRLKNDGIISAAVKEKLLGAKAEKKEKKRGKGKDTGKSLDKFLD